MRGILVDESAKVYPEPNNVNLSLSTLRKGDEFELGKVTRKNKEVWVEVTLPSGQTGFIPGETHIFQIKKVQMMNGPVELYAEANGESNVIKTYYKNDIVTATGIVKDDAKGWIKVLDNDGVVGYVRGETKIRLYMEPTKDGGKKQILSGALFAAVGIGFYIYSAIQGQTDNNMSILNIAITAFGLLQIVQGIIQYRNSKKSDIEQK